MKSNKLKKILAIAMATTMVSTAAPLTVSAAWLNDSQNNWNWTENGSKATGWKQVDGTWYHFDTDGKMQTGWVQTEDSKWYYMSSNGGMKTGWLKDTDGKWYNLAPSGEMKTGWLKDTDGKWYKLAPGGEMKTGWIQETDGKWYFTDTSGAMQTGVVEVQGKVYVFEASGAMATGSTVIGGVTYTIDASGAIAGDKLPIPEKAFTKEGIVIKPTVTSNLGTGTTGSTTGTTNSSSSGGSGGGSGNGNTNTDQDMSYDQAGTYGPNSGINTVNNVAINSKDVILKNMHIKGNLVLGEGIGEGDVSLNNVTVDGTTIVRGGGQNSIHFIDSVLGTVIVNKNDGRIRLVVEGNSQVLEVQLESPAKLEESGLSGGATGFNNVNVTDSVQTGTAVTGLQVELVGRFETINSRATRVRILLDEGTDIRNLILNAIAQVLGTGTINTATINSDGSTICSRPGNMVLNAHSVSLRDQSGVETENINQSYSNAQSAAITGIKLSMNSIKVNMDNFVAGLTAADFNVSAKLDGQDYPIQVLGYDANKQRFTFAPVSLDGNIGKVLKVTVTPASSKLTGAEQSEEVTVQNGFTGKITDIQSVGIAGVTLKFRLGADSRDGEVVATSVTDQDGYYTVYLAPGQYTGEISGSGVVKTYMYASSLSDRFNVGQNETAIRATAMDSVKIVLTWGERPRDEDSHLEGPTVDGQGRFHTWYGDKIYEGEDGIRYADLDWDDVHSYGPETTTIYNLVDGKYRFYVHNYSGEAPLVGSGAKVEVYKGSGVAPINTVAIPDDINNASARYWLVFDMDVQGNGETINVNVINELRGSIILKKAGTAETSYVIDDEWGEIAGVPVGTVADLKADLLVYDGGTLKVVAARTDVSDAAEFDAAADLDGATPLANGQIIAVKELDGTIKTYAIRLIDKIAPVIEAVSDANVTTSAAVLWEAPGTTATDDVDGTTRFVNESYSSDDDDGATVVDLDTARTHLEVVGNKVKVTYTVSDEAGNAATPIFAIFTAIADTTVPVDTTAPIIDDVFDDNVTTSAAVSWEAPETTATDDVDGNITANIVIEYSSEDGGSNVYNLESARAHLTVEGNTVTVTYYVEDAAGNSTAPIIAKFTAVN
jgi:hypothetical protein